MFGKKSYDTLESAKHALFNNVNVENFKDQENKIECMFDSKMVKQNIYDIINRKLENE